MNPDRVRRRRHPRLENRETRGTQLSEEYENGNM
jgi:hypothetical protein